MIIFMKQIVQIGCKTLQKDEIREMQYKDPIIRPFTEYRVTSQNKPKKSEMKAFSRETKILFSQWDILELHDDILYRNNYRQNCLQLVSPVEIQNDIFENLHVKKIAGHFGVERMVSSIKRRFYWPRMDECMKRWCESCDLCARCKPGPGVGNSPLQQFKVGAPLQCIALDHVDIVGPLPEKPKMEICTFWSLVITSPNGKKPFQSETILP